LVSGGGSRHSEHSDPYGISIDPWKISQRSFRHPLVKGNLKVHMEKLFVATHISHVLWIQKGNPKRNKVSENILVYVHILKRVYINISNKWLNKDNIFPLCNTGEVKIKIDFMAIFTWNFNELS